MSEKENLRHTTIVTEPVEVEKPGESGFIFEQTTWLREEIFATPLRYPADINVSFVEWTRRGALGNVVMLVTFHVDDKDTILAILELLAIG